jgi:hypothetical protein
MAEEGVITSTWDSAKSHPWIVGGAVVALVAIFYLASGSKSGGTSTASIKYNIGPSDAAIAASDQLQATQSTNMMQASVASSYYDYLAKNSATTNNANVSIAGINSQTALGVSHDTASSTIAGAMYANDTAKNSAAYASLTATTVAGYATQTALGTAAYEAGTATQQAALAAQTAMAQIGSTERLGANANATAIAMNATNQSTALAIATSADNTKNYAGNTAAYINTVNQSTVQGAMNIGLLPAGYTR